MVGGGPGVRSRVYGRQMTDRAIPIVCDMTDAPDTAVERIAEYQLLFEQHLVGRERTAHGIRFRLRADDGSEIPPVVLALSDVA